jgi:hypothetical protein
MTAPADLTGVDLDLVDETWEDRVCERQRPHTCTNVATYNAEWECGCVQAYCIPCLTIILAQFDGSSRAHSCMTFVKGIVRTWPVTR